MEKKKKKKFVKPEVKKVPLVAEEAVLASCKSDAMGGGPGGFMGLCQDLTLFMMSSWVFAQI